MSGGFPLVNGLQGQFTTSTTAAARPVLQPAVYKKETQEPVIKVRATFPESWIFDSFDKKYVDII